MTPREIALRCKQIVLRRTEVPSDAKNQTRDGVVILGEQIAALIDAFAATLPAEGRWRRRNRQRKCC